MSLLINFRGHRFRTPKNTEPVDIAFALHIIANDAYARSVVELLETRLGKIKWNERAKRLRR